jgi:hypothetical protein
MQIKATRLNFHFLQFISPIPVFLFNRRTPYINIQCSIPNFTNAF